MQALKNKIIKGLNEYMGCNIVPTDTAARKPEYPYLSYKITSPIENSGGFSLINKLVPSESEAFDYDIEVVRQEQAHFSLSVNAYSMDDDEACGFAIKAADWFKFMGYEYLISCNIVIVNVGNVGDRTAQIVDDYERRYGFDVRCRTARAIRKRVETIERHNFNSKINRRE